jgi:hypothetical protein
MLRQHEGCASASCSRRVEGRLQGTGGGCRACRGEEAEAGRLLDAAKADEASRAACALAIPLVEIWIISKIRARWPWPTHVHRLDARAGGGQGSLLSRARVQRATLFQPSALLEAFSVTPNADHPARCVPQARAAARPLLCPPVLCLVCPLRSPEHERIASTTRPPVAR